MARSDWISHSGARDGASRHRTDSCPGGQLDGEKFEINGYFSFFLFIYFFSNQRELYKTNPTDFC